MINLANLKMRKFIYAAMWVLFVIMALVDMSRVSSFDIMHLCSQPNLRTSNITVSSKQLPSVPKLEQVMTPPTHYLRHAVRI